MIENYLLRGVIIGIVFGVPVGIVGVITVQRTLLHGFLAGVITGLGSSVADVLYASISIFGLTLISDFLLEYQDVICVLGSLIIVVMGIQIMYKDSTTMLDRDIKMKSTSSFLSSFLITLTNPAAILSFMVIFSTFGISVNANLVDKILLVIGIFVGTGLWWILLSALVKYSEKFISNSIYNKLNKWFGRIIIILGIGICVYSLVS